MTAHTAAPWLILGNGIYGADETAIATFRTNAPRKEDGEFKANAKLIAAAPELLEALQAIVNYGNLSAYERSDAMKAAKAAIAKATR